MKKVFGVTLLALLTVSAQSLKIPEKVIEFKRSFPTGYVINGEDAAEHRAPYIVSLSNNFPSHSHICGGTLISKSWILTAAHCISSAVGMSIMAGLHRRDNITERCQQREVDFGQNHREYDGNVGPYDIALLHVSEPFELNEWVKIAAVPAREEIHADRIVSLYGWGQRTWWGIAGATTLQTVSMPILTYEECDALLPAGSGLDPTNLCSDSMGTSISACNGDSGGPLVIEHEGDIAELVGIVSWGYIPCGVGRMPSVYTRVSAYIDWIVDIQSAFYKLH